MKKDDEESLKLTLMRKVSNDIDEGKKNIVLYHGVFVVNRDDAHSHVFFAVQV